MKISHIVFTFALFSSIGSCNPLYAGKYEKASLELLEAITPHRKFSPEIVLGTRKLLENIPENDLNDFQKAIVHLVNTLDINRKKFSLNLKLFKKLATSSQKAQIKPTQIIEELLQYLNPQPSSLWDEDFIFAYLELRKTLSPKTTQELLPASAYGTLNPFSYGYSAQSPTVLSKLLSSLKPEEIQFGLQTLLSHRSIKGKIDHFQDIQKYVLRSTPLESNELEKRLKIINTIKLHHIESIPSLFKKLLTFENLKDTVFVIDLHGVLTVKSEPKLKETNVPARGFIVELLKDLKAAGSTLVLSSAWNSFTDILRQLNSLGLEKVFEFSETHLPKESIFKTETGDSIDYRHVGNVVSARWAGSNGYWKEKIFAPDILGLTPKRLVLIDDSEDNIQKGAVNVTETKAGLVAQHIELLYIKPLSLQKTISSLEYFSVSRDEENKFSEEDLEQWEKILDRKSELRTFPESLNMRKNRVQLEFF